MTKKIFIFLIGFVFLGLIVFAQTPEENFQKAGQAKLARQEAILLYQKAEIEKFLDEMAYDTGDKWDHVISGKEMKTLKKMVADFDKMQKELNKALEFYQLKTATEISEVIRGLLNVYFGIGEKGNKNYLDHADNESQDIRKHFTEKTGLNVVVEKSKSYHDRILLGVLSGCVACLLVILVFLVIFGEKDWILIPVGIVFVVTVFAFMFWL